ncbi:MAG: HAMP domain-containing sensor histidine kinase [Cyanobacteria bacterium P01_A01_bin.123]
MVNRLFTAIRRHVAAIGSPDLGSIQSRLTLGVVLLSIVGIGGTSFWMSWRMQQILLDGPKRNAWDVTERFTDDVIIYQEMMTTPEAVQKVIEHRSTGDLVLWIRDPSSDMVAQSEALEMESWQSTNILDTLLSRQTNARVEIVVIQNHHFVVCATPVSVNNEALGTLYVAQDITQAQRSFTQVNRSLTLVNGGVLIAIAIALSLYIRRALSPIRQINHLATEVSADTLGDAHLKLDRAPTEVQELAQSLDMMLLRLAEAWEYQRRFVNDVSHELRTPLSLINGYLQSTLRRCQTLTDMQREGLEIAHAETERTIRLLQDLLDLARADSGSLRFNLERIDPKILVQEVIEMAEYGKAAIAADLKPTAKIRIDRHRLKQVLINLIDNALKYSETNKPIRVILSQPETEISLQVIDYGRGIPLGDQTAIFEPFYRVDEDRSRKTGGTGLGLPIVKRLVESMGGTVKVKSNPGEGSTFILSFPACL